jgi:hypothetical protein
MASQGNGTILNISSMSDFRLLTRIPAYSGVWSGSSAPSLNLPDPLVALQISLFL